MGDKAGKEPSVETKALYGKMIRIQRRLNQANSAGDFKAATAATKEMRDIRDQFDPAADRDRVREINDALDALNQWGQRENRPHDFSGRTCWCGGGGREPHVKHFKLPTNPTVEFDAVYDCQRHTAEAQNIHSDPQIKDLVIRFDRKVVACDGPPGSVGCAKEQWDVKIDYTLRSDLDGTRFENKNIEMGTAECECRCGGEAR